MSTIKAYLADPANYSEETKRGLANPAVAHIVRSVIMRKPVVCRDGFRMSVQYSTGHYCNGRERCLGGDMEDRDEPYPEPRTVEVGFPSRPERLLKPFAEEARKPILTGYEWPGDKSLAARVHRFFTPLHNKLRWSRWRWVRWLAKLWPTRSNLTRTVYGWVPVEVVDAVIAKHGGLVNPEPAKLGGWIKEWQASPEYQAWKREREKE